MAKEHFAYWKTNYNQYAYHGFHAKHGRYSIDTKRLQILEEDCFFPRAIFTTPRNTHYFIPKYKKKSDWAINVLLASLGKLSREWNEEYVTVIRKIETPEEVAEKTRLNELSMTGCMDDLDQIQEDAFLSGIYRQATYEKVIKSIHLQFIQKIFIEFFRAILLVITNRGYKNKEDFYYSDFCKYVQEKFNLQNDLANPLFKLPHYKYLEALNKIDNFLKHNTVSSYNALANNAFEKDEEIKKYLSSFVYSAKEAGRQYTNGSYAGNWLKIEPNFINETIHNLEEFSKEFCELLYNENYQEASWNSDESLLDILRDEIIYSEW